MKGHKSSKSKITPSKIKLNLNQTLCVMDTQKCQKFARAKSSSMCNLKNGKQGVKNPKETKEKGIPERKAASRPKSRKHKLDSPSKPKVFRASILLSRLEKRTD